LARNYNLNGVQRFQRNMREIISIGETVIRAEPEYQVEWKENF
jgi:hypothetical protein